MKRCENEIENGADDVHEHPQGKELRIGGVAQFFEERDVGLFCHFSIVL